MKETRIHKQTEAIRQSITCLKNQQTVESIKIGLPNNHLASQAEQCQEKSKPNVLNLPSATCEQNKSGF